MKKEKKIIYILLCVMLVNVCGCSQLESVVNTVQENNEWKMKLESNNKFRESKSIKGSTPVATGKKVHESKVVTMDYSNSSKGYIMVKYLGKKDDKIKIRVTGPKESVYTYDCVNKKEYNTIPLTKGNGKYTIGIFKQVKGNEYVTVDTKKIEVKIKDKMSPFLHANQYVDFTEETLGIEDAKKLYSETETDLEFIEMIYDYTQAQLEYDNDKANEVLAGNLTGYIPNINKLYESGKGICFDYAVIMVALLRSQGIPAKLNIGYAGDVYHAWVSVFTKEEGWIDSIIEFNGKDWAYMDPTYADTVSDQTLKRYVGEGINYVEEYVY